MQHDELRHSLMLEVKKREQIEEKIKSVEDAEIRRSANKIAVELRNQQELEIAYSRIVSIFFFFFLIYYSLVYETL